MSTREDTESVRARLNMAVGATAEDMYFRGWLVAWGFCG